MLRTATGRRASNITSSAGHPSWKREPPLETPAAAARRRQQQRRLSNASFAVVKATEPSHRKRGPSLVEKAKELLLVTQSRSNTNTDDDAAEEEPSEEFRCLPDHVLSRLDKSASENEKVRLWIESKTRSFDLVQRWKIRRIG